MYPPRCAVRRAGPARPSSQTPISLRRVLKSPSFPYCFGVLPAVLTELPQTAESRRGFFLPHRLAARPDASESLITRALRCTERGAVPAQSTRETLTRDQLVTESRTMTPIGVQCPRHEAPQGSPAAPSAGRGHLWEREGRSSAWIGLPLVTPCTGQAVSGLEVEAALASTEKCPRWKGVGGTSGVRSAGLASLPVF